MTTPEALRDLYTALGGSSADVANLAITPELISALANAAATIAAATLPPVSSANNGQVLTVVNGKWAAAALPE
jgi:DNA-binding transcriptional regulator YdaS (Cro superfamily)